MYKYEPPLILLMEKVDGSCRVIINQNNQIEFAPFTSLGILAHELSHHYENICLPPSIFFDPIEFLPKECTDNQEIFAILCENLIVNDLTSIRLTHTSATLFLTQHSNFRIGDEHIDFLSKMNGPELTEVFANQLDAVLDSPKLIECFINRDPNSVYPLLKAHLKKSDDIFGGNMKEDDPVLKELEKYNKDLVELARTNIVKCIFQIGSVSLFYQIPSSSLDDYFDEDNPPIHYACQHTNLRFIELLLDMETHEFDLNAVNIDCLTPIEIALNRRDQYSEFIVSLLLEHGSGVDELSEDQFISIFDLIIQNKPDELEDILSSRFNTYSDESQHKILCALTAANKHKLAKHFFINSKHL